MKKSNLPNPTCQNDPSWTSFSTYLKQNGINEVLNNPAVNAYQNTDKDGYVSASILNHCINLKEYGLDSEYAKLSSEIYGNDLTDHDYKKSLKKLDCLFARQAYYFNESTVYKGVSDEPFYDIHKFNQLKIDEIITFYGFLSTSVCHCKAESFARSKPPILLEFIKIDCIGAIIPPINCVLNSPTPSIPEQEVLLDRGASFKVVSVNTIQGIRVIQLEAYTN